MEQDREDLNNERAGREVGRIQRFLPESASAHAIKAKRERGDRHWSLLRQLLAQDAEYRALYDSTRDQLQKAEAATDAALTVADEDLHTANRSLNDMLDKASTLPDGTKVFRDQNGDVWRAGGTRVTGDDLDRIQWLDGAPSYRAYLALKQKVEDAQRRFDDLLRYQVDVLGNARNRLMNDDDPPSKDDLRKIQDDIKNQAPDAVKPELKAAAPPDVKDTGTTFSADLPKL